MDISNTFNSKPVKVKKEVKEGLHEIRIDLLNTTESETQTYYEGFVYHVLWVK